MKKAFAFLLLMIFLLSSLPALSQTKEQLLQDETFYTGLMNAYDCTNTYLLELNSLRADYAKAPVVFEEFYDAVTCTIDAFGRLNYHIDLTGFIHDDFQKGETLSSQYYFETPDAQEEYLKSNGCFLSMSNSITNSSFLFEGFMMAHTNLSATAICNLLEDMVLCLTTEPFYHIKPEENLSIAYSYGKQSQYDTMLSIQYSNKQTP